MQISQNPDRDTIGARLRDARQSRGLQLVDIAGILRIKPQFLEALESDRPENLPTPTHASGFLRTYAHYLGVDLVAAIPIVAPPVIAPLTLVPPASGKLATLLPPLLVIGSVIILYALWHWLQAPEPAPIAPPPANFGVSKLEPLEPALEPQPESQTEPKVAAAPTAAPVTPPVAVPAALTVAEPVKPATKTDTASTDSLVVRAVSDAWVQITDASGRQLYSRLMRAGESWHAPQQTGLRLSTGNAGGLVLVKNGEASAPLGTQAQVLRNLPLTEPSQKPTPVVKPAPVTAPAATDDTAAPDVEE